jgi:hypothetical protein
MDGASEVGAASRYLSRITRQRGPLQLDPLSVGQSEIAKISASMTVLSAYPVRSAPSESCWNLRASARGLARFGLRHPDAQTS